MPRYGIQTGEEGAEEQQDLYRFNDAVFDQQVARDGQSVNEQSQGHRDRHRNGNALGVRPSDRTMIDGRLGRLKEAKVRIHDCGLTVGRGVGQV